MRAVHTKLLRDLWLMRGAVLTTRDGRHVLATIHPSAVLRASDSGARQSAYQLLLDDLHAARRFIEKAGSNAIS